ncbi:MAG: exonuclease SbcCD subunit D [Chloroflexi bacterium]|nr:exonuclease SbcCD subunit D [Chloroflexota bacterium]
MPPIRLLHFADLHIGLERYGRVDPTTGLNSRVMDFLRRLSDLAQFAIDRQVDMVLFAGDAYKNRDPNSTYRREFSWRIKEIADRGIPVVMIPGNHDLPAVSARASAIEIFDTLGVPNIHILDFGQLKVLETRRGRQIQVAAAPYPSISDLVHKEEHHSVGLEALDRLVTDKLTEVIRALAAQARQQPDLPTVLVGHFSVTNAKLGSERSVMVGRDVVAPLSVLADPTWDYVALGHIHKQQNLNTDAHPPVVYSGSLERIDFGEEREAKGWVLAEVSKGETRYEFVPGYQLQARRFVTISCDCRQADDPTEMVLQAIAKRDVADTVVRIRLQLRQDQDALLRERDIRTALTPAFFQEGILKEYDLTTRSRLGLDNVESMTPLQLLERYFEVTGVSEAASAELMADAVRLVQGE